GLPRRYAPRNDGTGARNEPQRHVRHRERSVAIHDFVLHGLPRRYAPRNDGTGARNEGTGGNDDSVDQQFTAP
ncbi:MAG: hypothetical protein WCJ76_08990, partial [Comamonadaceae bacterium]